MKDYRFFRRQALYIDYKSLSFVMQEIMNDDTYNIEREDFYCIVGYSSDHDTEYEDQDIINRLSSYLDEKISSYHADDDGVWFILA